MEAIRNIQKPKKAYVKQNKWRKSKVTDLCSVEASENRTADKIQIEKSTKFKISKELKSVLMASSRRVHDENVNLNPQVSVMAEKLPKTLRNFSQS